MHGWETLDTARCERCAIYTPTSDLVLGPDGRPYCLTCGAPPVATARRAGVSISVDDEWVRPPRTSADHRVRLVAGLMVLATLAFPLAACISQL